MQKKQGFTLIELLVVIAIIGILSAIGLTALTGAQSKARDVKRKADLGSLNSSLTLWLDNSANVTGAYPKNYVGGAGVAAGPVDLVAGAGTLNIKDAANLGGFAIPKAPTPYGPNNLSSYWYISDGTAASNPTEFGLFTKLENAVSGQTDTYFVSNSKGFSDTVNGTVTTTPAGNIECSAATTRSVATNYAPCQSTPQM